MKKLKASWETAYTVSRYLPTKHLITKGKRIILKWRSMANTQVVNSDHHQKWEKRQFHTIWQEALKKKQSLTSVVFPPKTYNPNLMMIKQITLKWNKNNWPVIFKSVKVMQVKDRMSNYSRKKLKEMSTICNICYLKWISLL